MSNEYTVFQRSNSKNWHVRFSLKGEGQKRKSLGTKDEAEANRKAAKLYHQAQYRLENGMKGMQRSFRVVAEEFIEHMHHLSNIGEKRHDRGSRIEPLVRRYFIPYFGDKAIDAIRDADVVRYLEWRKNYWITGPGAGIEFLEYERNGKTIKRPVTDMKRTPSLSSQKGEAVILRQLFSQAAKWGDVGRGLIPEVKTTKVPPSPRPSFSMDEMQSLLRLAEQRMTAPDVNDEVRRDRTMLYAYVVIAAHTGMRPPELKAMNWGDVLGYKASQGTKVGERDVELRARGKGKQRTFVPQLAALPAFDMLWTLWLRDHDGEEPQEEDAVFSNKAGKRLVSQHKALNSLLDAAKLRYTPEGKKRDSYSFRHFYISEQLRAGVDVFLLARNTGTSPDMIDKHYGQVQTTGMKDQLRPRWVA